MGDTKDLVGDRQRIDIQRWHRKKLLEPGKVIIHEWKNPDLSVISINVEVGKACLYSGMGPGHRAINLEQKTISRQRVSLGFKYLSFWRASTLVHLSDAGMRSTRYGFISARHALHLPRVRFAGN